MKITFFDANIQVCKALSTEFDDFDDITVETSLLEELKPHDCLVTAGNSYGIMNGGIDLCVREMIGLQFQDILQWFIVEKYNGILPVGCNIVINCDTIKFSKVIYAPTMVKPSLITPNDISVVFYNILKTAASLDIGRRYRCISK